MEHENGLTDEIPTEVVLDERFEKESQQTDESPWFCLEDQLYEEWRESKALPKEERQ